MIGILILVNPVDPVKFFVLKHTLNDHTNSNNKSHDHLQQNKIMEIEQDPLMPATPKVDGRLIKLWVAGLICMIFFGWFNYTANLYLTPTEAFAEQFPITETTCLLPPLGE